MREVYLDEADSATPPAKRALSGDDAAPSPKQARTNELVATQASLAAQIAAREEAIASLKAGLAAREAGRAQTAPGAL